jgi:uncharacterized protein
MARTALELTHEEWKQYTVPQKVVTPEIQQRWEKAWRLIPELAALLRDKFGVTRIKVFGSAIKVDYYWPDSDIDLAVWGLAPGTYYDAAAVVDEYSDEFAVDLVNAETCRSWLRDSIDEEGIDV